MDDTTLVIVALIAVIILILYFRGRETLVSRPEHAKNLASWINANPSGSYQSLKNANPDTNILEYEDMKRLQQTNKMTPQLIESIIS